MKNSIKKVYLQKAQLSDVHWISKIPENDWSESAIISEINLNENSLFFVNTKKTAFCALRKLADEVHVMNLGVIVEARNKGVGSQMLKKALLSAIAVWNPTVSIIEHRKSQKMLHHFYEKFGFKQIGVRKNYYSSRADRSDRADQPGEDAIVRMLDLIDFEEKYQNQIETNSVFGKGADAFSN